MALIPLTVIVNFYPEATQWALWNQWAPPVRETAPLVLTLLILERRDKDFKVQGCSNNPKQALHTHPSLTLVSKLLMWKLTCVISHTFIITTSSCHGNSTGLLSPHITFHGCYLNLYIINLLDFLHRYAHHGYLTFIKQTKQSLQILRWTV